MNKNIVVGVFAVLAIGTILFWVRLSSNSETNNQASVRTVAPLQSSIPTKPMSQVQATPAQSQEDFGAMMNALSKNMLPWLQMNDQQKVLAVSAVIELFKNQGQATIKRPAPYYVQRVNSTLVENESTRSMPLDRVMMILSVMDYDFDNGKDKDALAKELLGEQIYVANLERLKKMEEMLK